MTVLVEFRAGRMNMGSNGTTVTADPRKGMFRVMRDEDGLIHVMWVDRLTGGCETDVITFPGDATWRKVPQCTTGRVFLFTVDGHAKHFFWMQEPKEDRDNELYDQVRGHIGDTGGDLDAAVDEGAVETSTEAIAPQQLVSVLEGGTSSPQATTGQDVPSNSQATLSEVEMTPTAATSITTPSAPSKPDVEGGAGQGNDEGSGDGAASPPGGMDVDE